MAKSGALNGKLVVLMGGSGFIGNYVAQALLERNPQDLDLFHPWNIDAEQAIELARRAKRGGAAGGDRDGPPGKAEGESH